MGHGGGPRIEAREREVATGARPSRVALVLGAGGTVGLGYHAGALRALEAVGGFVPGEADLVVGTSAGSVVAAYLRAGWTTEDFWQLATGTHPSAEPPGSLFTPRFRTGPELARRLLGSAFVVGRSVVRLPAPATPRWSRRVFPGGLFDMAEGRARFAAELPAAWPSAALWLCAVDITSGRRVVLGRPGSPSVDLHQAVTASCAIPGVYQPVKAAGLTLVDGGTHSTTNVDVAARDGCDLIVCVAPMAYDTASSPSAAEQVLRRFAARRLAAEVSLARSRGVEVLMIRPTADEVRAHGVNFMRSSGWERIARMAYDAAARIIDTPRFRHALGDAAA